MATILQLRRLDHMHFDNVRYVGWATSNVSGVADHIRYDMVSGTADNSTRPMGIDQDNTRWNQATNFGTQSSWFYVEDSYFSNGIANDCFSSGKQVYRYNYMTNSGLQQHGTGHAGSNRGCRAMEVYGNNINGGATSHTTAFGYYSGPMVMFGNSVGSGTFNSAYQLTSTRSSNYTYSQGPTPGDHGYCGSAFNGTASQWDGNNPVSTGYPCLDQVGRGIGDLLSSDFPTLTNSTLGCIVNDAYPGHCSAWPRQALEPAYEWSDTGSTITGAWDSVYNGPITKNVDYYTDHSNTNCSPGAASCTAGIGVGTLAQRPANCTTGAESGGGVGWWATDQGGNWNTANGTANDGALYKCTATNTWTLYYTPYTYPNPLQGGGGGGDTTPPSTPTNLAASAISSSQINLTWTASTDNVGVTGYKIFRGGTQVGTSATNSYSDTGLSASTAYSYTVSAYDAAGNNSAQSSSASATTQSGGNGINGSYSTNFTGTENPMDEISGAWINGQATGIDWGDVAKIPGLAYGPSLQDQYADPTAVLTGTWASDQQAQATVKINGSLSGTHEVELRLRTTITSHSITGYEINCAAAGGPYVQIVRWNGPINNFTYVNTTGSTGCANGDVLKATMIGNTITVYKAARQVLQGTDSTYTSGAPGIGFYDNRDSNWTSFGFSSFSASNVSGSDTTPPSTPTSLSASAVSSSQINLTWIASADNVGVTGYKIFRGGVQVGTATTNSYSDTGLSPSTAYTYTVSAYDAAGNNSAQSASASATTQGGGGAIAAVAGQSKGEVGTSALGNLTFTNAVTSGNQVIVTVQAYRNSAPVINAPTKVSGTAAIGAFARDAAFSGHSGSNNYFRVDVYRAPVTGSGTLTLGFSGTFAYSLAAINEYSGMAPSPVDGTPVTNSGTGATESSGNVTTSDPGGMVFMSSTELSTTNFTYTQSDTNVYNNSQGASGFTGQVQQKLVSTAGISNLTAATGNSWYWLSVAVAYKAASGGGDTTQPSAPTESRRHRD